MNQTTKDNRTGYFEVLDRMIIKSIIINNY